jgi:hypothetical protein
MPKLVVVHFWVSMKAGYNNLECHWDSSVLWWMSLKTWYVIHLPKKMSGHVKPGAYEPPKEHVTCVPLKLGVYVYSLGISNGRTVWKYCSRNLYFDGTQVYTVVACSFAACLEASVAHTLPVWSIISFMYRRGASRLVTVRDSHHSQNLHQVIYR